MNRIGSATWLGLRTTILCWEVCIINNWMSHQILSKSYAIVKEALNFPILIGMGATILLNHFILGMIFIHHSLDGRILNKSCMTSNKHFIKSHLLPTKKIIEYTSNHNNSQTKIDPMTMFPMLETIVVYVLIHPFLIHVDGKARFKMEWLS